ncbi:hypothetical protein ABID58_006202 [Bradyrhizobium sp. S3.2.6]|uniref:hypothetical protein n=1 Tax=Bradyrhizobium sp. S3.2.6 TaxID=3156428 RepID=UPI003397DF67
MENEAEQLNAFARALPLLEPLPGGKPARRNDMVLLRTLIAVSLVLGSSTAHAQNCKQYPPGPQRRQCAAANNPAFEAKLERCKDEARAMGLTRSNIDPAIREYVQACMHRR